MSAASSLCIHCQGCSLSLSCHLRLYEAYTLRQQIERLQLLLQHFLNCLKVGHFWRGGQCQMGRNL
jgi:heterodisulfide reductase subunit C